MTRGKRKSREELSELARLLLDLRERARLTQPDAAEAAGISQSKLSRAETDRGIPDIGTVRALAGVYQASPAELRKLIELVSVMQPARLDSRLVMQRGENLSFQQRVRSIERSCALVRAYQPGMVLGMLQTQAYARAIFTAPRSSRPARSDSPENLAAERASRYQQLVADQHRFWTLIHTEGALNWHVGSPQIMVEQMERLIEASQLPHVRVGIIPARTRARVFAQHGFHLYDRRAVHIGTKTATALSTDSHDIAEYEALFEELERIAVFDDPARQVINAVADAYRGM
jgi:transcriptional regulator with XRE-family HTH domain